MKKILLSLVLAVSCNLSFGQNVTDLNFTGCLAKATFAQFSVGASNSTLETAAGGWVSAIAAPTVDVSNITDMAFTISGGYSLITSPTPAAPVPTNYTNSIQPLSGWVFSKTNYAFVYIGKTATLPADYRYRGVNIFIHKLVPTSVPYIVANSQQTSGFAHCGEVVNTGGGTPQLHTNGQAIYLAFNSAADLVKFQIENGGVVGNVEGNPFIYVEKSADLTTWTSLQDIQLVAPQNPTVKTDYAIAINDPAARYIRLRMAGLIDSRNRRKSTIRSIAVQLKPVITWNQDLTGLKSSDTQVTLTATSTATSASTPAATDVTYVSSNEAVVSVAGNVLTVVGAGETTITAKQLTNSYYAAAAEVVQNVKVVDLGTGLSKIANDTKLVFGSAKGIVSKLDGTLQIYSTTGMLLKNQLVSKNQIIPMTAGAYLVRASVAGKSISQVIVL
jgi:hypothetical protein